MEPHDDNQPAEQATTGSGAPTGGGDPPRSAAAPTFLHRLDAAMAEHPAYPRFLPFVAYLICLAAGQYAAKALPASYPIVYLIQCGLVVWLLRRYRKLLPELTLSFHWLALPVGAGVFLVWIWLGMMIDEAAQVRRSGVGAYTTAYFEWMQHPESGAAPIAGDDTQFNFVSSTARDDSIFVKLGIETGNPIAWLAFSLRLLGMTLVVPLFEELFIRSLLLRSLHRAKATGIGFIQVMQDFPGVGDWLMNTKLAAKVEHHPPMFEKQFNETPLGAISYFGVAASTLIFALSHVPRDYAGCVVCGIAYCLLLRFTRHKGLGPVCWAHGITNALIWIYTLHTGDWRFL